MKAAKSRSPARLGSVASKMRRQSKNSNAMKASKSSVVAASFEPRETYQLVSSVDKQLNNAVTNQGNGLFDEDAHNMKRKILL